MGTSTGALASSAGAATGSGAGSKLDQGGLFFTDMLRNLKASEHFDLVVIGSGPAAQKCAIDSAKRGKKVAIIDKRDMFGGVCVHTGTIPSKVHKVGNTIL